MNRAIYMGILISIFALAISLPAFAITFTDDSTVEPYVLGSPESVTESLSEKTPAKDCESEFVAIVGTKPSAVQGFEEENPLPFSPFYGSDSL